MLVRTAQLGDLSVNGTHRVGTVLGQREEQLGDVVNVLGGSRDDLLQVLLLILQPSVVQLVLEGDGAELGHIRRDRSWLGPLVDLSRQVHDFSSVVKDSLMWMV